jgi:demethylmenaquinone methyltransferase/2-methoxy-6-polyprenyl-1,4-benzoquinol methylase/phosphoethanolamine N-methyltransferase
VRAAAPPTTGRLIRWARWYDVLLRFKFLGQLGKLRQVPLDLAALRPGERVLDVGCGTGELTLAAARRVGPGGSVVGIDAAPEMIEVARGKARRGLPPVRFLVEPVEALSFPDGSFDAVLSSLMIHHLPGDLKARALGEIRRVLRPGGRIVIIDIQATTRTPRPWEPGWLVVRLHKQHGHPGAPVRRPGAALADLLHAAGFAAIESGPTRYDWLGYAKGHVPQ